MALKYPPAKPSLLAVVAIKLAGTFMIAFLPKTIPAGFTRKRLELPPDN